MARYRKKPLWIDAIQWTGKNGKEVLDFGWPEGDLRIVGSFITIPTLEGEMRADKGDWIIKGIKGEFYPCKPDIFAATYEDAE
jgi:hypothetical protein